MRLRRNAAGGYRITGLGAAHPPHILEQSHLNHWLKAVNARPEDGWSSISKNDLHRVFRRTHLIGERERAALRLRNEVTAAMRFADGLASYEVAAFIQRSIRSARRFLSRIHARRLYFRPNCRTRIWTKRYGEGWRS